MNTSGTETDLKPIEVADILSDVAAKLHPVTFDLSRVPFRILRPLQKTLAAMCKSALVTITPMPVMLVAKVIEGEKISERDLVNPTRAALLGHVVGWYKLLKEIEAAVGAGAVQDSIRAFRSELGWLETLTNDTEKARTVE